MQIHRLGPCLSKAVRAGLAALALLAAAADLAAQPQSAARQALAAERSSITQGFEAEEADCQSRFAVTGCVADVRARRRDALAPLRERELRLDDQERRERVAQRESDLAAKRQAQPAVPADKPAIEQRLRKSREVAGDTPAPHEVGPPKADTGRAALAAERAKAAAKRSEAALATQAAVAKRLADRAASGKAAAGLPLPVVPPASAASAVRP
jgi:colicin import membrane protein